ncbi:MAG TPA: NTP transferase domain-containing protein [Bacteroidia bacterium]|nr:NTP transferase domain-containing protein [Bacteroidia bacterium]
MKPLYGLVICGGESSRMGRDKSLIEYYGKPQRNHIYEMLAPLCEKVFISCNKRQASTLLNYPIITDADHYQGIGPMASLLSAFEHYPDANFLLVACDYPLLTSADLSLLLEAWDLSHEALTFFNQRSGFAEPLLGIYSACCYPALLEQFRSGNHSLQEFLRHSAARQIVAPFPENVSSTDTPEAYEAAILQLKKKRS